jgi:hypothetical protein
VELYVYYPTTVFVAECVRTQSTSSSYEKYYLSIPGHAYTDAISVFLTTDME